MIYSDDKLERISLTGQQKNAFFSLRAEKRYKSIFFGNWTLQQISLLESKTFAMFAVPSADLFSFALDRRKSKSKTRKKHVGLGSRDGEMAHEKSRKRTPSSAIPTFSPFSVKATRAFDLTPSRTCPVGPYLFSERPNQRPRLGLQAASLMHRGLQGQSGKQAVEGNEERSRRKTTYKLRRRRSSLNPVFRGSCDLGIHL